VALEIAANLDKANPEEAEMVRALAKRLFDAAQLPATVEAHPAAAPLRHEVKRTTPIARVGSRAMLMPRDMAEAVEIAKLMATAHGMVGLHLLNNPGGCLGVVLQAMNWGFSPFAVASKTYVAAKEEDLKNPNKPLPPISYEAQLVHAVILSLAPTEQRPEITFEGEGGDMRCIIIATFKGASQPSVLRSEPLSKLKNPKGSPLWEKKPQQQLAYNAVRDWARRYCPDVILGVYTPDEMADFHIEARPHVDDPFAGEGPRQLTIGSSPMATTGAGSPEPVPVSSSKGDAK
jgi:hypothetical protein